MQFSTDTSGTLTVVEYAEPPSVYDDVPGSTIAAMRICGSPAAENATAAVRLRVPRSELRGSDASALRLAHWVEGRWELLDTTAASAGQETVVLTATPEGLSPFAVTAVGQPDPAATAEPNRTATTTSEDGPGFGVGAALLALLALLAAGRYR